MPSIKIEATYVGNQPIISILERNLDVDEIVVTRQEYAIKSIFPLELLITVPTVYLLNKFLLEPLIGPVAEKWKNAVIQYLSPIQAFTLTIQVTEEDLLIEVPTDTSHDITAKVWEIVNKTLDIIKQEDLLKKTSKIRFMPGKEKELLIICYAEEKPFRVVNLDKKKTDKIPESSIELLSKTSYTIEDWLLEQEKMADAYQRYLNEVKDRENHSKD